MNKHQWEKRLADQIPGLIRYARALTHNSHYAEDLLQDCLERAWSRRLLFDENRDLRVWLFTIMHNLYINHLNKLENRQTTVPLETLELGRSDGDGVALRDFENALRKLRPEYREILILVGVENLSYTEIAEVLNIPLGTVTSRLYRARENLRFFMHENVTDNVVKLK